MNIEVSKNQIFQTLLDNEEIGFDIVRDFIYEMHNENDILFAILSEVTDWHGLAEELRLLEKTETLKDAMEDVND